MRSSKNTVAENMKRSQAVTLALLMPCFAGIPAWAQSSEPHAAPKRTSDIAAQVHRSCLSIAAWADRGPRAFRAARLINDKVLLQGEGPRARGFSEAVRWADEITVLRVGGHSWRVDWNAGKLDGTVALIAATDGMDMCRFHTAWRTPTLKLLPDAEPGQAGTYRSLLLGRGLAPPSANLDAEAIGAALDLHQASFFVSTQAPSWRVDLMNNGRPLTLIRVELASGAGSGCDHNLLGLVRNGQVVAGGIGRSWMPDRPRLAAASPALQRWSERLYCGEVAETPVLDRTRRTYVLFDNLAIEPDKAQRIKLLVGARNGTMRALARLSWKAWNKVVPPSLP